MNLECKAFHFFITIIFTFFAILLLTLINSSLDVNEIDAEWVKSFLIFGASWRNDW